MWIISLPLSGTVTRRKSQQRRLRGARQEKDNQVDLSRLLVVSNGDQLKLIYAEQDWIKQLPEDGRW